MPRYVILQHDHPVLHWDFMLESGQALRTWRLAAQPAADQLIPVIELGKHRLAYLDYEGPVSGDRGTVSQWDRGEYDTLGDTDSRLVARLRGRRLNGTATLVRVGSDWSWRWTAE
jgi:DNA polymerase Ligase (LigD)